MAWRMILVGGVLVVLALFVVLNWALVTSTAQLHLLVARLEAPLGLVLLAFAGVPTLVYMVILGKAEADALMQSRKQSREIDKIRAQLEDKELGEFRELKNWLEAEFAVLYDRLGTAAGGHGPDGGGPAPDRPAGPRPLGGVGGV